MDEFLEKNGAAETDKETVKEESLSVPEEESEAPQTTAQTQPEEAPEKTEIPEAGEEAAREDPQPAAEISLEGRKVQLEKKISEQLGSDVQPVPAADANGYQAVSALSFAAPETRKRRLSDGTRAYIIVIAGITAVFLVAFVLECARAYKQNGVFGGDLNRFLDTDYSAQFGDDESDSDDVKTPFGGLFPFSFDDSDDLSGETDDSDETAQTDSEKPKAVIDSDLKSAPSMDSVTNPASANLEAKDQPKDIDSAEYTARSVYKKVTNSVVSVVAYTEAEYVGEKEYKTGTGSGMILSEDGYILTNSHVINDSNTSGVEVVTTSGERYAAACVGYDTRTDLAVIKIDAEGLSPVTFMNSDQLEVGQDAIAIGSPGGLAYSNSLTKGVVSALNRTVPTNTLVSYIQTDAAINPGNSGGPLLNSAGQVMGVTTVKIANTDYEGMGFAIPSNMAIDIANSLIANGFVSGRVRIGILGSVYTAGQADGIYGISIIEIYDDSPLKETDVQPGDVITAIDGNQIRDFTNLYSLLGEYSAGEAVELNVYRPPTPGNASKTFSVTVKLLSDER